MMVRRVRVVLDVETDGHLRDLKAYGLWDWMGSQHVFRVKHANATVIPKGAASITDFLGVQEPSPDAA